jgi:hypothetical protein
MLMIRERGSADRNTTLEFTSSAIIEEPYIAPKMK